MRVSSTTKSKTVCGCPRLSVSAWPTALDGAARGQGNPLHGKGVSAALVEGDDHTQVRRVGADVAAGGEPAKGHGRTLAGKVVCTKPRLLQAAILGQAHRHGHTQRVAVARVDHNNLSSVRAGGKQGAVSESTGCVGGARAQGCGKKAVHLPHTHTHKVPAPTRSEVRSTVPLEICTCRAPPVTVQDTPTAVWMTLCCLLGCAAGETRTESGPGDATHTPL